MADSRKFESFLVLQRLRKRREFLFRVSALLLGARRRYLMNLYEAILVISRQNSAENKVSPRSLRRHRRNTGWWEKVWHHYSGARFKKTLRVSRNTFSYILDKIRHRLERETKAEEPISPELRLAVCLYRLGRGDCMYTISEMVGIGVSTVCTIVHEVCEAIIEKMLEEQVQKLMPQSEEEFKSKILDMDELWQFPCCWPAIDGCHIPIKCPPGGLEACKEYHNFKNFYSIVLMAMVDAKYRFIWGSCGYPGNSHDSIIFQSTDLWSQIQEGFIPNIGKKVEEVSVQPLILVDSAFPHTSWLMKSYTAAVLTPQQHYFNYRLSRARMVTEGAYGQMKGRWTILLRKCESDRDEVRSGVLACMVLHNVCIEQGDRLSRKLDLSLDPHTQGRRNRRQIRELLQMTECRKVNSTSAQAQKVRDALCQKLWIEKISGMVS